MSAVFHGVSPSHLLWLSREVITHARRSNGFILKHTSRDVYGRSLSKIDSFGRTRKCLTASSSTSHTDDLEGLNNHRCGIVDNKTKKYDVPVGCDKSDPRQGRPLGTPFRIHSNTHVSTNGTTKILAWFFVLIRGWAIPRPPLPMCAHLILIHPRRDSTRPPSSNRKETPVSSI